jgi:pyridoxal 5'-phosphate synthase pdxT subunit
MSALVIGVLALQGAFAKHMEMLKSLGVEAREIRKPSDLAECDALIIPGGESTTIMRQIQFIDFANTLINFAKTKPVFGTCAGLILISREVVADPLKPFGLLDIAVERNAFGRQIESFIADIEISFEGKTPQHFPALFIRAPRIRSCSPDVKVLSQRDGEPILVQQGNHLGATFHPELTNDLTIHQYFLNLAKKAKKGKGT